MSPFGLTELTEFAIFLLALVASATDIAKGRIYNWLTFPMILLALICSFFFGGFSGLAHSFLGLGLGLLLYGWMFWIGVLGAGDVKLLMALGAWGGVHFVEQVALFGIVFGGVMAIGYLVFKGQLKDFVRRFRNFFTSLWLAASVDDMKPEPMQINRKSTMPFGVPISVAAILVQLRHL